MASTPASVVNHAVVELTGLGRKLSFTVIGSDSPELPPGSSFVCPGHVWSAAFAGNHPHVKCDIQPGHVYFVGKLKTFCAQNAWGREWRPFR